MDRRATRALIAMALLATSCTCGSGDFDIPEAPPEEPIVETPGDPRIPPGFDLAIPDGATVRYGEATARRATVLVTTDDDPEVVLRAVRDALEARAWTVRVRDPEARRPVGRFREAIEAREGETDAASAIVERGAAEITRLHLTRRISGGHPFHAPEEPREWRVITRAPLPAVPGPSEIACNDALRTECEAWAAAGGPDALDCALDHRNACGRIEDATAARGFADDARERLRLALAAHARVGSRGARAYTLGQLRVELLGAKANLVRAAAAGAQVPELAALVAATEGEGVRLEVETSFWFNPDEEVEGPAEIPEELAP